MPLKALPREVSGGRAAAFDVLLRGGLLGTVVPAVSHGLRYIGRQPDPFDIAAQRRLQPDASDPRILYGSLLSLAAMTTSPSNLMRRSTRLFPLLQPILPSNQAGNACDPSTRLFPLLQPTPPSNQADNACDPSTRLSGILLSHDCSCFDDVTQN